VIDLPIHLALFVAVVLVIILVHGFFYSLDDREALKGVPWRAGKFLFWCAVVAGAMIVAEHTVASIH
jgi:hypothetical protein